MQRNLIKKKLMSWGGMCIKIGNKDRESKLELERAYLIVVEIRTNLVP